MIQQEMFFKTPVTLDLWLDKDSKQTMLGLLPNENFEVENKVLIDWTLELETRDYGVKSFIITVPAQEIQVELKIWGESDFTYKTVCLELDKIITEVDCLIGALWPKELALHGNDGAGCLKF